MHRLLSACLLALVLVLVLVLPAASQASITLTSPSSGGTYSGSLTVSYTISETPDATNTVVEFNNGSTNYLWYLDNSVAGANSRTVTGVQAGTYTVSIRYLPAGGGPSITSAAATGVVIDTATQVPTLTSPSASAMSTAPVSVAYTLPEQAGSGTAKLLFTPSGGGAAITLTLASPGETAGSHTFAFSPAAPTSTPEIASASAASIPDGTYSVTLTYSDLIGNAASSVTHAGFRIDTLTTMPSLLSPAAGANVTAATLPVSLSLAEAAQAGSVKLFFTGAATRTVTLAQTAAGAGAVTLDRANLAASTGVSAVAGGSTLPDGTYTVTLTARDALGNADATSSSANVVLATPAAGPGPTPPTTAEPAPPQADPPPPAKTNPTAPKLTATWRLTRTRGTLLLRARLTPFPGAKRYVIVARRGATRVRGTCRARACTVALRRGKGRWTVTVRALGPAGALATATRRVGEPTRR